MINLKIINENQQFSELKESWNKLLGESNANNVFLTWEWLYTWWKYYCKGKQLLIIVAEENGEIIGIAPFFLIETRFFGLRKLKHIEFIGSTDEICSEYLDFILKKGREKEVLGQILKKISNLRYTKWEVLNLVSIRKDSDNLRLLKDLADERGYKFVIYASFACPHIVLPKTKEEFYKTLSGKTRYRVNNLNKKIQKDYKISLYKTQNTEDLKNDFESFIDLHLQRWEKKGGNEAFIDTSYNNFHKEISIKFLNNGWLHLVFLKVNEKFVAAQYDFIYGNKMYYFQVGFLPVFSNYKVGNVLQSMVLDDAINRGISEFDFLRGIEEYKYRWTKENNLSVKVAIWKSKVNFYETILEKIICKFIKLFIPSKVYRKLHKIFFGHKLC